MLAFVTSMRHPANADDYAYNEVLLQKTLRSIALQTREEYVVIVVGNRAPSFELPPRTHFISVDFAPPARVNGPHADRSGFVRDKGSKIGVGLIAAREYAPDWVMIFDADDFINRSLVEFVMDHPNKQGWVITDGLIYSRARNGYRKQSEFHRTCGTSYIIPFDAYRVPDALDIHASQHAIVEAYGEVLPNIMGAHRNAVQWHREHGRCLKPVPFRAAVYHVDTGENHSGKALSGVVLPWRRRLGFDFGVSASKGSLATAFACIGPVAIGQSLRAFARRGLRLGLSVGGRVLRRVGLRR